MNFNIDEKVSIQIDKDREFYKVLFCHNNSEVTFKTYKLSNNQLIEISEVKKEKKEKQLSQFKFKEFEKAKINTIKNRLYPDFEKKFEIITLDNIGLINLILYKTFSKNILVIAENKFNNNNYLSENNGISIGLLILFIGKLISYEIDILNKPILFNADNGYCMILKENDEFILICYEMINNLKLVPLYTFVFRQIEDELALVKQSDLSKDIIDARINQSIEVFNNFLKNKGVN